MNKNLLVVIIFFAILSSQAQNISYKTVYDSPVKPWWSLNLEVFQIDLNVNNLDAISFNLGAFGYIEPMDGLGIDYTYRQSWLHAGQLGFKEYPPNRDLELGVHYIFASTTKTKTTKITLSREYKGSTYTYNPIQKSGVRSTIEEIKFIRIPATRMINTGLRAGLIRKSGPYNFAEKEDEIGQGIIIDGYASLKSTGVYFGLLRQFYTNVFAEVEDYGIRYNSIGRDFFIDLLYVPTNTFAVIDSDPNISDGILNNALESSPFGFRIGFATYQTEKKSRTGKFFGTGGKLELGLKPYQGLFAMASFSITLVKAQNNPFTPSKKVTEESAEPMD